MCKVGVLKIEVPPDVVIVLPLKQRGILIQAWRNRGGQGGAYPPRSVDLYQPGGADYANTLLPLCLPVSVTWIKQQSLAESSGE